MTDKYLSVQELRAIARNHESPCSEGVLSTLDSAQKDSIHVVTQPARRTAKTLEIKYSDAAERGFHIKGFRDFIAKIESFGSTDLWFCTVQGKEFVSFIAISQDLTKIEAIFCFDL